MRRPTLHELIGLSNERGLSNYLRGEGDASGFIQKTPLPKLHVLTAGNMPMSDIGVLAGDKIRIMLDELKSRYDLVLIDAPPVLGISDGSIIAREVDYVHSRHPASPLPAGNLAPRQAGDRGSTRQLRRHGAQLRGREER